VRGCFRHALLASYPIISGNGIIGGYSTTPLYLSQVSDFLISLVDVYTWYRFRSIRMNFIPSVGVTYTGQVTISITDGDEDGIFTQNSYSLSSYTRSVSGPVYQPLATQYVYNGPKVWLCHQSSYTDSSERNQISFQAMGDSVALPNGTLMAGGAAMGFFWFDYDIELYGPRSAGGNPSFHAARLLRSLGDVSSTALKDQVAAALVAWSKRDDDGVQRRQPDPENTSPSDPGERKALERPAKR
jgi:hypothetical protein